MAGLNVNITQDPNYFWDLPGWTSQDLINASESGSSGEGGEVSMLKAPVSVADQKAAGVDPDETVTKAEQAADDAKAEKAKAAVKAAASDKSAENKAEVEAEK